MPRRQVSRAAPILGFLLLAALVAAAMSLRYYGEPDRQAGAPATAREHGPDAGAPPAGTPPPPSAPESERAPALRDLSLDERRGGHTLARHVGRSDVELRERLRRERISAASTYTDRATAERVIGAVLVANERRIEAWLAREGNRPNLALDHRAPDGPVIGRSLRRGDRQPVPCRDAVVVLRWDRASSYFVLTSYPEAGRR